jgi:hypothetical protein
MILFELYIKQLTDQDEPSVSSAQMHLCWKANLYQSTI